MASLGDLLEEMVNNRVDSVDRRERLGSGVRDPIQTVIDYPLKQLREQIDQIARNGLGFPTAKGGLIAFADGLGAGYIYDSLKRLSAEDTVAWQPCPTIEYCALNRVTFADYVKMRSGF